MEEGDRQGKRTRHSEDAPAAAAAASAGGGGGGESDEVRQRREERERPLRKEISDTEGLLSYMMAFLPINLMVQLAKSIWQHAAPELSDVTISSATKEERSFWQHVRLAFVTQLAARLTHLTAITLHYPTGFTGVFCWCFDVFVAIIEGHIAGRRAADLGGGTLETITLQRGVRLTNTEMQTLSRTRPPLPALLDPPPTLHALTTIDGLTRDHHGLADRRRRMPSLTTVQQHETWGADRVGRFISSSRSLRRVGGSLRGEDWAGVFEGIPAAPAGQRGGPLAQLESIDTIKIRGDDEAAGIDRLQAVLVARGCRRSLKQLHVELSSFYRIGRRTLPTLLAVDRLVGACCRPDAPLTLTAIGHLEFDLAIFYQADFPARPSPSFKTMMQQLARQAWCVQYIFTQDGLTDPYDKPSQSAIEMAKTLSFDKATDVLVMNADGFDPPANTAAPLPAIVTHLQQFPKASRLCVESDLGGAAGRLLAAKMPKEVGDVDIGEVSGDEKVGVLEALGREREVGWMNMGEFEGGVDQLVGAANRLPTIKALDLLFDVTLPDDVEEAGSFVRTGFSSVVSRIRGLQRVYLIIRNTDYQQGASIGASLPGGTNIGAFTITHEHRGLVVVCRAGYCV
ncbi:unnamed protein product [Vitrella brassicaformis CCMP3155]|uniref:Uncharacterized protein n=2 Tax=Vitrella brassicaformis TaxID=1169539 RepID=A0A0G4FN73_VITBC|nr:unnamed protein product [Vitrella brassicaformis CCMP3155]|eukprot:CEM15700.1 unnamed protein product [Vitrella brassicaformis CCMP3155]